MAPKTAEPKAESKKVKKSQENINRCVCVAFIYINLVPYSIFNSSRRHFSRLSRLALVMKSGKFTLGYKTCLKTLRSGKG